MKDLEKLKELEKKYKDLSPLMEDNVDELFREFESMLNVDRERTLEEVREIVTNKMNNMFTDGFAKKFPRVSIRVQGIMYGVIEDLSKLANKENE